MGPKDESNDRGIKSVPVKIEVDIDDHRYPRMIEIAELNKRSKADKKEFMELLEEAVNDPESDFKIIDPTDKFNFTEYILNGFRCYQSTSKQPEKGVWKFQNYKNHHETQSGFINSTTAHPPGFCEILTCSDKYLLKNEIGEVLEKNSKTTWWLSYKY